MIIYLNKDWEESYGGHLELWDKEMTKSLHRILPIFNRMVVFTTTDFAYHGHPEVLKCPEGQSRKSLALFYYTNGRPASEINKDLGERLWDLYVWKNPENLEKSGVALTTLISKRYPSECLDMKVVFHYPSRNLNSGCDFLKMSYAEYVQVKATAVLQFGIDKLEKLVEGGREVER